MGEKREFVCPLEVLRGEAALGLVPQQIAARHLAAMPAVVHDRGADEFHSVKALREKGGRLVRIDPWWGCGSDGVS